MAELAAVLARPHLRPYLDADEAAAIVDNMDTRAIILDDPPPVNLFPDPKDNAVLAAAITGRVDLIVSGDKQHMPTLGEAAGIPIVTARAAMDRIGKNRNEEALLDIVVGLGLRVWLLHQALYRYVPSALMERRRIGSDVRIEHWLRAPLREWAEALLAEKRLREAVCADEAPILRMWGEHVFGKRRWHYYLWDVLMFQMWWHENGRV